MFKFPLLFWAGCLLLCPTLLSGQILRFSDSLHFNVAAKITFAIGRNSTSFYNVSLSAGINQTWNFANHHGAVIPGAQLTANYYSRGLGTGLIDPKNRVGQLDIITSLYVLTGGKVKPEGSGREKYVRPFNQMSAATIYHNLDYSVAYGTNFIVNTSHRNQQTGFIALNADQIMLGYYNDGFWPFARFAGDRFDRYWTGGGYLAIGLNSFGMLEKYDWTHGQYVEYAYDRFTGNVQSAYKLSKDLLLFGIPQASVDEIFLNRALSSLSLRNINGSNLGISVLGQCPNCDIQDFLHRKLGYSRHISFSKCNFMPIGSYQKNFFYTTPQ